LHETIILWSVKSVMPIAIIYFLVGDIQASNTSVSLQVANEINIQGTWSVKASSIADFDGAIPGHKVGKVAFYHVVNGSDQPELNTSLTPYFIDSKPFGVF